MRGRRDRRGRGTAGRGRRVGLHIRGGGGRSSFNCDRGRRGFAHRNGRDPSRICRHRRVDRATGDPRNPAGPGQPGSTPGACRDSATAPIGSRRRLVTTVGSSVGSSTPRAPAAVRLGTCQQRHALGQAMPRQEKDDQPQPIRANVPPPGAQKPTPTG